jgi:hypothetical protein
MIQLVIWINLSAQSVCTYQVWKFLVLECSASSEESIDYKFVIFGLIELKILINQANRRFDSNLKMVSDWTHKIRSIIILLDSRCSKDSNGILFAIFGSTDQKIWISKDLIKIWFQTSIRIEFISWADTWQLLIGGYRFGWITDLGRRIEMKWTRQI